MGTPIIKWRFLHHVGLVVASCLVVASLSARAAEDTVEIEGEVVAVTDGRVRVDLGAVAPDAPPARGDSVSFHKTVDGFELDAGTGVVDEVGAGFVWVGEVGSRISPGMEARIEATRGRAQDGVRNGAGSSAAAPDQGELERVMRRHWEAMGGDAWADVESLRVSGQESFGDKTGHFRFTWKRPDRFSIESSSDPIGSRGDAERVTVFGDGKVLGKAEGGPIERGTESLFISIDPYFRLEEPLSHWRSMGLEITLEGREEMRGAPVYHVRVRRKDTELSYFIHAETYRLAHTQVRSPDEGLWWALRSYNDYEPADGLMIARSLTRSIQEQPDRPLLTIEREVRRVEVNVDVDDSFTIGMDVALANQSVVGTVEQIADGRATVSSRPGRVGIAPGQLVRFESRIPGVDEVVESASGYVLSSKRERFRVAITQGETAIGDEAVLLPEHRDGRISTDEDEWYRMEYEDIWKAARLKPPNLGALCALARHYRDGGHVKKNPKDARALYRHASGFGPPALCAYEYGTLLYDGDLDNPSAMRRNPQEGEKWIRYSAEHGSYDGMCSYAGILELRGEYAKAIRWLKKARAIEPEVLKNLGSVSTDIERIRRKQRRH